MRGTHLGIQSVRYWALKVRLMTEPAAAALVERIDEWLADDTSGATQAGAADTSVAYRLGALVRKVRG